MQKVHRYYSRSDQKKNREEWSEETSSEKFSQQKIWKKICTSSIRHLAVNVENHIGVSTGKRDNKFHKFPRNKMNKTKEM